MSTNDNFEKKDPFAGAKQDILLWIVVLLGAGLLGGKSTISDYVGTTAADYIVLIGCVLISAVVIVFSVAYKKWFMLFMGVLLLVGVLFAEVAIPIIFAP